MLFNYLKMISTQCCQYGQKVYIGLVQMSDDIDTLKKLNIGLKYGRLQLWTKENRYQYDIVGIENKVKHWQFQITYK